MTNFLAPTIVARVSLEDLNVAQAGLERNAKQIERGTKLGTKQVTIMVWRAIRSRTPVRTGRLLATVAYEMRYQGRRTEGAAFSNLYYARYVNDGTRYFAGRRFVDRAVEAVSGQIPDTMAAQIKIT